MTDIDRVITDIKTLKIQGATNICLAVLETLAKLIDEHATATADQIRPMATLLASARPTEPLTQNAVRYLFSGSPADTTVIKTRITQYTAWVREANEKIAVYGDTVILDGQQYLTHCHASSVISALTAALKNGKQFRVTATETRPLFQGRQTAAELVQAGIGQVRSIIDSAAGAVLSDAKNPVNAVCIGADMMTTGGFVNKIGTYQIATVAAAHGIPVYCFTTLLKFFPGAYDPEIIEQRNPDEIWPDRPEKISVYAPAFDLTPWGTNIHVVCEEGIIQGEEVTGAARKRYPFIINENYERERT